MRKALQRLDFDTPLEIAGLYVQPIDGAVSVPVEASSDGLRVPGGAAVSFDTYFNAFFENYWFGYTNLTSVHLQLKVKGSAIVTLWRETPEQDRYLLQRELVDGAAVVDFAVAHDDELRVEAGRIWCEVEALGDSVVESGEWWTDDEPRRPVDLAVVFCTFNREKYLQRILRAIDADDRAISAVARIFVINQGNTFTAQELIGPDITGRVLDKLTIIEQPNLGGCGGFTRGMYETLIDENLTHFLVMDDDSRVNPESIARAGDFLAHCDDDVVVGGHMLNLHRPNRVFEAGAMFDASNLQPGPIHHDIDLGRPGGLAPFLRTGAVSYNGWWMFGASTQVIEDIGYPMPCFIRGDDMEFGMRVRAADLRTIPVPGIAVWHEPFYLKLGGWQFFFEVRNRLSMAAMHRHNDFQGIRKNLRRVFARDIAMCRYHSCQLMIEGIRAYSQGPDVALDTTDGPLKAAAEIVAEYGPTRVDQVSHAPSKTDSRKQRSDVRKLLDSVQEAVKQRLGKVVLVGQVMRRLVVPERDVTGREPVIRSADLEPYSASKHDAYIVVEEQGEVAWRFQRDRALEKTLWREFLPMVKQVVADDRYPERFDETNQFADIWREIFDASSTSTGLDS